MRSITTLLLVFLLLTVSFAQRNDTAGTQGTGQGNGQSNGDGAAQAPDAFFIGAGPAVLDNLQANDWSMQFVAGRQWNASRFLAPKGLVEVTTDFGESLLISALLGANFYPIQSIVSPYIGAGAGLGYARAATDEDAFGFDLSGTFGLLMFQQSPLKVKVETSANFLFRELLGDDMPMAYTARVAVLF